MFYTSQSRLNIETEESVEPDIKIIDGFISGSQNLFRYFRDHIHWDGRLKSRKTASYGLPYNYPGFSQGYAPMHSRLIPICRKINQEFGYLPNNCSLNFYIHGDNSIGYHSDTSETLKPGTGVAIVSLGGTRTIRFRHKNNQSLSIDYHLACGSVLYMRQFVQSTWMHGIPKMRGAEPRISLTFRHIEK